MTAMYNLGGGMLG